MTTKANDALLNVARRKNRVLTFLKAQDWPEMGYKDEYGYLRELYGSELSDSQLLNAFVEQYAEWDAEWNREES